MCVQRFGRVCVLWNLRVKRFNHFTLCELGGELLFWWWKKKSNTFKWQSVPVTKVWQNETWNQVVHECHTCSFIYGMNGNKGTCRDMFSFRTVNIAPNEHNPVIKKGALWAVKVKLTLCWFERHESDIELTPPYWQSLLVHLTPVSQLGW